MVSCFREELTLYPPAPPAQGGNDYEIFESAETLGHTVTGPADTISQIRKLFY